MKVQREEFLRKLETVSPGLSTREILEQSSCLIFLDGEIVTFNDEICCRTESGLDRKVKAAVPAKPLVAILQKLQEDEVDVSLSDGELVVTGKGRSAGIRTEAEINLPCDGVEKPGKWRELHPDFLEGVSIVQNCASRDESQFDLTCVHIHPRYVEACDNFQLTRYKIKTGVEKTVLVRKDSIKHVVGLGVTEFSETDNWIHFRNPTGLILSCRRYLDDYKDLTKLLDVQGGHPATLPKGLAEAAEKAEIFSGENVDDNLVTVELKPGRLRIEGKGVSGWYRESKKVAYDGEPIRFLINPKLLVEIVRKTNDCILTPNRLKVDGGKWQYVSCLSVPEEDKGTPEPVVEEEERPRKKHEVNGDVKPRKKKVTISEDER